MLSKKNIHYDQFFLLFVEFRLGDEHVKEFFVYLHRLMSD